MRNHFQKWLEITQIWWSQQTTTSRKLNITDLSFDINKYEIVVAFNRKFVDSHANPC